MRVLIVGCGQLGSRHLQAVASLAQVKEVEVVAPRLSALKLGQDRLNEMSDCQSSISFRWLTKLNEASKEADLCVLATQADCRLDLFQEIIKLINCKKFIFEKLVAQSMKEYEELLSIASGRNLSIWINCKARAHDSHKRVKSNLDLKDPIIFTVSGGNHGLANNGVHAADLFVFFDGAKKIEWDGGHIDPILHPSKRGNRIFDLSGTMVGHTEKGSHFAITFSGDHVGPTQFVVMSKRYRAVIDDVTKWFYESTAESGWKWKKVPFDSDLMVSNMSRTFVRNILSYGGCELPTLQECYPAHQFILENLQPHFDKILGEQINRCPVT